MKNSNIFAAQLILISPCLGLTKPYLELEEVEAVTHRGPWSSWGPGCIAPNCIPRGAVGGRRSRQALSPVAVCG